LKNCGRVPDALKQTTSLDGLQIFWWGLPDDPEMKLTRSSCPFTFLSVTWPSQKCWCLFLQLGTCDFDQKVKKNDFWIFFLQLHSVYLVGLRKKLRLRLKSEKSKILTAITWDLWFWQKSEKNWFLIFFLQLHSVN